MPVPRGRIFRDAGVAFAQWGSPRGTERPDPRLAESLSLAGHVLYLFEMAELPTVYPLRDLFDVAARGRNVQLTCRACGHVAILGGMALWWLFQRRGWCDDFKDVRRRCVCAQCRRHFRRRVANPALALVELEATDSGLPLPPAAQWKKELRRRR